MAKILIIFPTEMILAKLILRYNILNSNICSLDAKLPFFIEKILI